MKREIPQWVIEYNNANHQSGAGKAIKILMEENERMAELLKEERTKTIDGETKERLDKSAEDYWFEYSHESIVEGLRAITEANFKQAIRACQSDCIESLMNQIEYQNKEAKESRNKIMELEFQLKEERNKVIDECIAEMKRFCIALYSNVFTATPEEISRSLESLKSQ